MDKALKTRCVS